MIESREVLFLDIIREAPNLGRYILSDSADGVILLLFGIEEKSTDRYNLGCSNLAWIASYHRTRLSTENHSSNLFPYAES
jgi:hypothetical protein